MIGLCVAFILAGACGVLVARTAGIRPVWAGAVLCGHLAVFGAVLLLELAGLRITMGSVSVMLVVMGAAVWPWGRRKVDGEIGEGKVELGWWALGVVGLAGVAMAHVVFISPLQGWDTSWRWDFLARQIAKTGSLSFYPARSPNDFEAYGYAEGFPPIVSMVYAYVYLAAGRPVAWMTGFVVMLQWGATVALTARAAESLRPAAGQWAAVALVGSGLFFWGTAIGQETGLTALAAAGLFAAAGRKDVKLLAMAFPLALVAVCREYGPALAVAGSVMLLIVRGNRRQVVAAAAVGAAIALPWYVRNAVLTGNPLWSHPIAGLPGNEVYARIMAHYREVFSPGHWDGQQWRSFCAELLTRLGPALLLAPAALLLAPMRRSAAAILLVVGVGVALFWTSISYTSGGTTYAMRVLTPAIVGCAVLVGGVVATRWTRESRGESGQKSVTLERGVLILVLAVSLAFATREPRSLTRDGALVFRPAPYDILEAPQLLVTTVGTGGRVLTDDMETYVQLTKRGVGLVPIWSPEVAFLFRPEAKSDESLEASRRRLRELNIKFVALQHVSDETAYNIHALKDAAFLRWLNHRLLPVLSVANTYIWALPDPTAEASPPPAKSGNSGQK